jgi:hypothetical protein
MKKMTLMDLYLAIAEQVKQGNGDKVVLVADDDEGNGYHPIYYAVTPMKGNFTEEDLAYCNTYGISPKDCMEKCIVLG